MIPQRDLSLLSNRLTERGGRRIPERAIAQQLAAQIPWFHNCMLLDRVKEPTDRYTLYGILFRRISWTRELICAIFKSCLGCGSSNTTEIYSYMSGERLGAIQGPLGRLLLVEEGVSDENRPEQK